MPSMKNCRIVAGASHLPSGPVTVAKTPMMNEPVTFTSSVPHGNVSPTLFATNPDAPQRARLPNPPPTNIQNAFHMDQGYLNSADDCTSFPGTLSISISI